MTQKSTYLIFKQAWTFPEQVQKRIANFMNKHPGKWLHAPVGISKLGKEKTLDKSKIIMYTLDKDPSVKPDFVCDIFKMSDMVGRNVFDGVISDPVWYTEEKDKTVGLSYPQRRYLGYEVRDILKPGGYWVFNGLWLPQTKGMKILEPIEIPAQKFASFRNVSLIVYSQKVNGRI